MTRSPLAPRTLLACLALAVPTTAQLGSVVRERRINRDQGGFPGTLSIEGSFGYSLASLGDLNGDGVGDLAVAAANEDAGADAAGAVWILFLRRNASVAGAQKISATQGGFTGTLGARNFFGRSLATIGDLDGDGRAELAVLAARPNRLYVLFLNPDGTVRQTVEDSFSDPVFDPPTVWQAFGTGDVAAAGDLDGDGLGDLWLGAPKDEDGADEAGAVWAAYMAADGTIRATKKISQLHGGFTGPLEDEAYFGFAVEPLGDLDGDGIGDLLVSAGYFDDGVWILHLDADENVIAQRRFDRRQYGLMGATLAESSSDVVRLGDLDGDGITELALGFPSRNFPGGGRDEGGLAIASLDAYGDVLRRVRISSGLGGLDDLAAGLFLGTDFAPLGDLDGDGTLELAVGAPGDLRAGGVWILSLQPSATRNGSGVNPLTLAQDAGPVFGDTWRMRLDCSAHRGGTAVLIGASARADGPLTPFGEALIGGTRLFALEQAAARNPMTFALRVPPGRVELIDLPLFVQGLCTGSPTPRLSNALDVVLGR